MARSCVFCGSTQGLTREHAIPMWISRLLIREGPVTHHAEESGEMWDARYFETKAKVVCGTCNSGWLSDLEAEAQSIFTPMILPGRRALHRRSQKKAAAVWIYKTALVWQLCLPKANAVPESAYSYLYEHREPPPGVQLWIGRYDIMDAVRHETRDLRRVTWYRSTHLELRTDDGVDFHGYATAFHIANLGAYVFGYDHWAGPYGMNHGLPDALIQLWPPAAGASVYWPPRAALSPAALASLIDNIR